MNLAGLLTGIGGAGSDIAQGKMDAEKAKLDALFNQLGLKQGQTNLQESQERLRKLQASPGTETEKQQQIRAAFKSVFNRDPTEDESKILFGLPTQAAAPKVNTPFELWRARNPQGTYDDWVADSKKEKDVAPQKTSKTVTYDPSGHLRISWVDPSTGKVSAWGPLAEAKGGVYHYKDEETGNIYEIPTFKPNIKPGEIRMSPEAQNVWENELHGKDTYATGPVKKDKTPGARPSSAAVPATPPSTGNTGRVIGHTLPKDEVNLKKSVQDAKDAYTNYIDAQKNILTAGSKGQLALVINAAKAQVAGAGRLTNAEIQNEISFSNYGEKFKRAFTMATEGKLTQTDQDELLNVIRNNWTSKASPAKDLWKTMYRDKDVPSFMNVPSEGGGGEAPPPGSKVRDYSQVH